MFYIQQVTNHDCGFTCMKMLLANLHKDENYLFMKNPFPEKESISFSSLIKLGEDNGVKCVACFMEEKDKITTLDKCPYIMRIINDGANHAVYVYKITKKRVYYVDPNLGKRSLKLDDFNSLWDGYFLSVTEHSKMTCLETPPILAKRHERVISLIISFFSGASCILGIYFLNNNYPYYLSAILLSLMIILEIIGKKYAIFVMKNIDERILDYYDDIKSKDYYSFCLYYEKYKKYVVMSDLTFFSNVLAVMMIIMVLLVNAKINVIYVGASFLLSVIYSYLIKPYFLKKESEINISEDKLHKIKDVITANGELTNIRKNAYSYADNYVFIKYVIIAIQLLISFVVMKYSGVFSLTYIICYLFLEIYLYQNFNGMFEYRIEKQKANNVLAKLLSLFEKNSQ